MNLNTLGLSGFDIAAAESARATLESTSNALEGINAVRAQIGAAESRLNTALSNLAHFEENTASSFAQIRDADIAHEASEFTKLNILSQSGVAVLAQANAAPQLALKLLG